jgi:hypothetical protein
MPSNKFKSASIQKVALDETLKAPAHLALSKLCVNLFFATRLNRLGQSF